ncbi:MAG: hypothetical protein ACI80P_000276 [Flavobacteriales bacterium]|jgi:hypothetical protein
MAGHRQKERSLALLKNIHLYQVPSLLLMKRGEECSMGRSLLARQCFRSSLSKSSATFSDEAGFWPVISCPSWTTCSDQLSPFE